MISVMFVCHGNICRSPMAELLFKAMVKKRGMENKFHIASSATSTEEIGNGVHHGTRRKLASVGISTDGKYAVQLTKKDYQIYDYILGMEQINVRNILRIVGNDNDNKVCRLLDYSEKPRDIADPWYTGNFDETFDDITEGLEAFFDYLTENTQPQ